MKAANDGTHQLDAFPHSDSSSDEYQAREKLSREGWAQSTFKKENYDKQGRLANDVELFPDRSADINVYFYYESGKLESHNFTAQEPDGDNESYMETFSEDGQLQSFTVYRMVHGKELQKVVMEEPPQSSKELADTVKEIDSEKKRLELLH